MKLIQLTTLTLCTIPLMASAQTFTAKPKNKTIKVYKSPFVNSSIIYSKTSTEKINIEYCNKYKWCKIEGKEGFVKQHQLIKLSQKEPEKISTKKEARKIELKNKEQPNKKIRESTAYKEAFHQFKNKNYEKSFLLFDNLSSNYPNNEYVNFYYGRSAFELKNYEIAFTAFDRILISNSKNNRARLEFGRTLLMMKSFKEAKKEFHKVLLSPIPLQVRTNVEKMIKLIESKEKNYILNKVAIFGFGWDDNINNNTYISTTAYGSINVDNDTLKKQDTHMTAILVGNLIIPNKKNNQISSETTIIGYAQEQSEYKDNNIQLVSLTTGISRANKGLKNLLSLNYDHIWLGGTQTLYIYGVSNNLKYKLNTNNLVNFDMKFKNKKFFDNLDFDKNSKIKEFSLSHTKKLSNKKDNIKLSASHISERKIQGTRTDVDKNTNKYQISYNKHFLSTLDITFIYQKEINKYKDISINSTARDDDKDTLSTKLSHKIDKSKIISLEYKNIRNESNINTYTYKKQSVNLNYTLIF